MLKLTLTLTQIISIKETICNIRSVPNTNSFICILPVCLTVSWGICRTKWQLCQQPGNILAAVTDDTWVISTKPYGRVDQLHTPRWIWSSNRIVLPLLQSQFNIWLHNLTEKTLQCSTEVGTVVLVPRIVVSVFSPWIVSFGTSHRCAFRVFLIFV